VVTCFFLEHSVVYQIQYIKYSWLHSMTDFNKICCRLVIGFLRLKNVQPQQIYKRMTVVYGEDVPSYPMVTGWAAEFQYEPRSRRPCKDLCKENCRAIENTVTQNRRVSVLLIANGGSISTGWVKMILCHIADDNNLRTRGPQNSWKNEGLLMRRTNWKSEAHVVGLEFVCEMHSNRRWNPVKSLWPGD